MVMIQCQNSCKCHLKRSKHCFEIVTLIRLLSTVINCGTHWQKTFSYVFDKCKPLFKYYFRKFEMIFGGSFVHLETSTSGIDSLQPLNIINMFCLTVVNTYFYLCFYFAFSILQELLILDIKDKDVH